MATISRPSRIQAIRRPATAHPRASRTSRCRRGPSSSAGSRRCATGANLAVRLQAIDDLIETLLLDLRSEIRAEALDVGNSLDDPVPGLPARLGFAQTEIDRHTLAGGFLHFGAHGRGRIGRVALVRQDD